MNQNNMEQKILNQSSSAMFITAASQGSQINELVEVTTPKHLSDVINDHSILLNQHSTNDGDQTMLRKQSCLASQFPQLCIVPWWVSMQPVKLLYGKHTPGL